MIVRFIFQVLNCSVLFSLKQTNKIFLFILVKLKVPLIGNLWYVQLRFNVTCYRTLHIKT